jgi:hypothetical protein
MIDGRTRCVYCGTPIFYGWLACTAHRDLPRIDPNYQLGSATVKGRRPTGAGHVPSKRGRP